MGDDPTTKKGRARMLRRALAARRDVDENDDPQEKDHHVEVWSSTIDNIKQMQQEHGD